MILTCPACQTRYQADAAKFPPQGRTVRCAKCGEVWHQAAPEMEAAYAAEPAPPPTPSYPVAERPPVEEPRPQVYVQPPEREFEPHRDESEPAEHFESEKSPWPRRIAIGFGWAALAGAVLVIAVAASVWRQQVVQFWPQAASVYSKFGIKVTASGLNIHDIKSTKIVQDGQEVLTVVFALTNVSNKEQPVPQVRVALVDVEKRELYHWTIAPEVMTLRPGQSTHFVARLSNPPEGAHDAVASLTKAGE